LVNPERTNEDEERSIGRLQLLAPKIRDHKDLEVKLTSAPPSLRTIIYNTVKPYLRFKAWPLDKYVASAGQMAERQQLPVMDIQGMLHPFKPAADVRSVEKHAEEVIASSLAARTLTLTCSKCTRKGYFYAVGQETPAAVMIKARQGGWVYDPAQDVDICPDCPTSLRRNG
jgi:hypothetical protein